MAKYFPFTHILVITLPFLIFYSNYKLSRLRDYNRTQKKSLHRLTYLVSIVLIVLYAGTWYINRESHKISMQKITNLTMLNERLSEDNSLLAQDTLKLRNTKKKLTNENFAISTNVEDLSRRIQELKSIVYQKDQQIIELEKKLKQMEFSEPQFNIK